MSNRADAFVIWVDWELSVEPARRPTLKGRVEHVRTSERAHFASAEELVRFLEKQLAARGRADPGVDEKA